MMYLRKYSTCAEPDCTVILNRHCLWKRKSNSWLTRNKATNAIFSAERWKRSQRTTLESVWIIKLKTNGYFPRQFDVFTFARILMRYFKSRCLTHLGHIYTCHLRHKPFISVKGWPAAWISRLHLRFRIWQTALEFFEWAPKHLKHLPGSNNRYKDSTNWTNAKSWQTQYKSKHHCLSQYA